MIVSNHAAIRYCARVMRRDPEQYDLAEIKQRLALLATTAEPVELPPHAMALSLAKHGPGEHRLHKSGVMLVIVPGASPEVVTCYPYSRVRLTESPDKTGSINVGGSKRKRRERMLRDTRAMQKRQRRSKYRGTGPDWE